jgi:predicted RNA-binding Zn ribbon-like protein
VQLFVNSVDLEHEREWLGSPAALRAWLEEHLGARVTSVGPADVRRALELREALRGLLRRNAGAELDPAAVATINDAARTSGVTLQVVDGRAEIAVVGNGVPAALGRLLAIAFGAMLDGSWPRLKVCRQCRWAFYDYSRNRSGSWCSMTLCGNRAKTRSYRRRKAGARPR